MNQSDWNSRVITIDFLGEPANNSRSDDDNDVTMTRTFTDIRKDATPKQVMQFSQAVSTLTPNGDYAVNADVYDHYLVDSDSAGV